MSITIKEVAREAQVSIATVSRVFTGKGPVNEETRIRVLETAARLRYTPHSAARSLITNRTSTLGALLPDIYGEFFSELIRGLDVASRAAGYHLLVSGSHSDRAEVEAVLRAMRGRVDGLVVMTPEADSDALAANLSASLPIVVLSGDAGGAYDAIEIDNHGGAVAMTAHLAALGHRRIAFVRGPAGNREARDRLRGYREALQQAGLPHDPALELPGDFTEAAGVAAGTAALALPRRPDAIFAANDAMAIGVLAALRAAGLRVPEDCAIAGFDDIPVARYLAPPLTSVGVRITELGERAIARLLEGIDQKNGHERRRELLETQLVVRASCGAGAAAPPKRSGDAAAGPRTRTRRG